MKLLLALATAASALALSACGTMGGNEGPAPGSPASRAPAAIPPPMTPAPVATAASPMPEPVPEDIPAVSADKVKCIPPYVLQTVAKAGVEEPRCVAPSEASAKPPG
ncbi:MAG TPA: hypothetical protein PLN33_21020 [Hyphomonadaceae bacterium]|nr:hypothetical protein [Hyphomonadaceae bacterium]